MKFPIALVLPFLLLAGCRSQPAAPLWNVPLLVGKPIDAVKATLGPPQEEVGKDATLQSTWKQGDITLSATSKTSNKRVTQWTLVSRDESHAVREEDRAALLVPGTLKDGDPKYTLDWIEAENRPLFYTGVRVIPALRTHAVVLRFSGSASLVEVSYSVAGTQPKDSTQATIAQWEEPLSLPDDSKITLSATIIKAVGPQRDMKIEIVSDGKVVASAASSGASIKCEAEL